MDIRCIVNGEVRQQSHTSDMKSKSWAR
nr:fumarylacetoacetate hydrolase family protein [Cohnella sp. REN36]